LTTVLVLGLGGRGFKSELSRGWQYGDLTNGVSMQATWLCRLRDEPAEWLFL